MEQKVCDTKHIRELLLFNTVNRGIKRRSVLNSLFLRFKSFQPANDKSARTAGKISHLFTDYRLYHLCHEVSHSTGRVKLAGRACTLQLFQDRLINIAKCVAFLIIGKVKLINDVDYLAKQNTVLHVVVGVLKCCLDDSLIDRRSLGNLYAFQRGKQRIIDEIKQIITCQSCTLAVIYRPITPTAIFGDNRLIGIIIKFPIFFLCVVNLEKQQPSDLLNTLCITVDTCIVSHNIP